MKSKIGTKVYDVQEANFIGAQVVGSFGDANGFEERLYRRAAEDYFLVGEGGPMSPYPQKTLLPLSLDDAKEWMYRVIGQDRADAVLAEDAEVLRVEKEAKAAAKATKAKTTKTAAKTKTTADKVAKETKTSKTTKRTKASTTEKTEATKPVKKTTRKKTTKA